MRRLFGIVIALGIPMAVIAALAIATYRPGPPDAAGEMLSRYLNYLGQTGRPAELADARPASYPRRFTANLSGPTFGNGYYFAVSYTDALQVTLSSAYWANASAITHSVEMTPMEVGGGSGGKPLPYPPDEVWCVRLKADAPSAPAAVLLALHDDLYVAYWVVHELPAGTQAATLQEIGCEGK